MAPGVCESLFTPVLHPPPFTHPSTCSSAIDPPSHPPFIHLPGRTAAFTSPIPLPARLRPAALRPPALSGPPFRGHTRFPPSTGLGAAGGWDRAVSRVPSAVPGKEGSASRRPLLTSCPLRADRMAPGWKTCSSAVVFGVRTDLCLRAGLRHASLSHGLSIPTLQARGLWGAGPVLVTERCPGLGLGGGGRDPSVSCGPWNSPVPPHTWPVDRYDPVADAEGGLGGGGVRARWPRTWHLGSRLCSTPSVLSCPGAASWLCPGDTSGSCSGISPEWPLGKCRGDCPELLELSFKSQQS